MIHPLIEKSPAPENIKREADALIDQIYDRADGDDCSLGNDLRSLAINACTFRSELEPRSSIRIRELEEEIASWQSHASDLESDLDNARDDRTEHRDRADELAEKVLDFACKFPESPPTETVAAFRELFAELLGRSARWRKFGKDLER